MDRVVPATKKDLKLFKILPIVLLLLAIVLTILNSTYSEESTGTVVGVEERISRDDGRRVRSYGSSS